MRHSLCARILLLVSLYADYGFMIQEAIEGMQTLIDAATHRKNRCSYDIVAWHVDAQAGQKGFSPHRDRQPQDWMPRGLPKDVRSTFRSEVDGRVAKYNTCWLAVSEASAENSCLYFLPQRYDPGYLDGDLSDEDPMLRAFGVGKHVFQHIRSVPLPAGGCSFHTHRIIHWGSAAKEQGRGSVRVQIAPRIAISCAFSDNDFEPSYLKRAGQDGERNPKPPSFPVGGGFNLSIRLALAGAQVVNYADRWIEQLPPHVFDMCHRLFAVHACLHISLLPQILSCIPACEQASTRVLARFLKAQKKGKARGSDFSIFLVERGKKVER